MLQRSVRAALGNFGNEHMATFVGACAMGIPLQEITSLFIAKGEVSSLFYRSSIYTWRFTVFRLCLGTSALMG